jgi:hypothetical protein
MPPKKTEEETEEKGLNKGNFVDFCRIYGKSNTESEFAEWIRKRFVEDPVVKNFHPKWKELVAWKDGDQYSLWDDGDSKMKAVALNVRRVRLVINLMKPLWETIKAKINLAHSVIGVANSGEAKDVFGAQVASKFLAFNDANVKIDETLEKSKEDCIDYGVGGWCVEFDKNLLGRMAPKKDGKPDLEKAADIPGDVNVRYVPIFNLRFNTSAKEYKKATNVIEAMELTRDEMLEAFELTEEDLEVLDESKDDKKFKGMNEPPENMRDDEPTYVVYKFIEKKTRDYKKGRLLFTIKDRVLFADENRNPKQKHGYYTIHYEKKNNSFWNHGPLYFVQDLQRWINRLISIAIEHIEAWKPKLMVGMNALKRANSLVVDNFEVLEVDYARGEPRPVPMPELSPQVAAVRDWLVGMFYNSSNVHEVSYSRLPQYSSRAPASLYEMMLENENTKLDPFLRRVNAVFLDMDEFRLELMEQHYTTPRMVKIVGKNRAAMVQYFSGSDLNKNFDVKLEVGASLAQSTSIKTRLIIEAWNQNILDPSWRPKVLRALNIGTAEFDLREDVVDMEKAIRENQAFIDDKDQEKGAVEWFIHDDHRLHMEYHTTLAKTEEFSSWPDERKARLLTHTNLHMQVLALIDQAAQGLTAAPGGGPNPAAPGVGNSIPPGGGKPGPVAAVPGSEAVPGAGGGTQPPVV